jgi:enoyl-CoA hydratase
MRKDPSDYSDYQTLKIEKSDGIAVVTLNRPPNNLVSLRMHTELADIPRDLNHDNDVRAIIFRAEGRHFASGGEFEMFDAMKDQKRNQLLYDEVREHIWNMLDLDKPTISIVQGQAAGMGCQHALLCDMCFAEEEKGRFVDGHMFMGVPPGDGGALVWPMLIGVMRAKRYLFTSDPCPAKEAERIGLITGALPADKLMPTAMEWATRFVNGPPHALKGAKAILNQWYRIAAPAVFHYAQALQMGASGKAEFDESVSALKEKRKPKYR